MDLFPEAVGDKEKIFTVAEISRLIKNLLEQSFPSIWVEGEVSKALDHPSGHLYITLKEEKDVIDATMWRSSRKNLQFSLEVGMKILVKGRVSSYGPYGKYQLIAERIEPAGLGALQIKFEQLKKKLAGKGYFDEERKKPIPEYPETIGLVTSESGAAFRDMVRILRRRNPSIKIILAPVLVEGEMAKAQIAQAINDFNRYGKVDIIIAGRGGGSPESLWAFNEEVVADAIYRSRIPVISAVGHEIDFTIADFVADLRASTPSAAAELAVKNRADLSRTVNACYRRLVNAASSMIREYRHRLAGLVRSPALTDPTRFLEGDRRRVDENLMRITNAVKHRHAASKNRVASQIRHLQLLRPSLLIKRKMDIVGNLENKMARRMGMLLAEKRRTFAEVSGSINALSPLRVLERGYSITRRPDGEIIKDEMQVKIGETLELLLHRGQLECRVDAKKQAK